MLALSDRRRISLLVKILISFEFLSLIETIRMILAPTLECQRTIKKR